MEKGKREISNKTTDMMKKIYYKNIIIVKKSH